MTILPRWFQVGFLALAGAGLIYVLFAHFLLSTDVEDIYTIEQTEIAEIVLSPPMRPSIETEVPVADWLALRSLLERSDRVLFTGWKGESWKYYCSLTIKMKSSNYPFMLELRTRPSMDGKIVFQLSRGTTSSQFVYGSYTGNAILEYLRESFPNTCES